MKTTKSGSKIATAPDTMIEPEFRRWRPDPDAEPRKVLKPRRTAFGQMSALDRYEQAYKSREGMGASKGEILEAMKNPKHSEGAQTVENAYNKLHENGYLKEVTVGTGRANIFLVVPKGYIKKKEAAKTEPKKAETSVITEAWIAKATDAELEAAKERLGNEIKDMGKVICTKQDTVVRIDARLEQVKTANADRLATDLIPLLGNLSADMRTKLLGALGQTGASTKIDEEPAHRPATPPPARDPSSTEGAPPDIRPVEVTQGAGVMPS